MPKTTRRTRLVLEIRRCPGGYRYRLATAADEGLVTTAQGVGGGGGLLENLSAQIFNRIDSRNLKGEIEKQSESLEEYGRRLFQTAFPQEVSDGIRSSQVEFLILDLDLDSIRIPWELAHDGSDFLCCRFSIGRKVQSWEPQVPVCRQKPAERSSVLVLSNPTGDLSAASQEGELLSTILHDEGSVEVAWLNNRISLSNLKAWLPGSDLLHFCGHCDQGSNCSQAPGWEMTDGRFTGDDIRRIREDGQFLPLLVFSNACTSGNVYQDRHAENSEPLAASFLMHGCLHYVGVYSRIIDRFGSEFAQCFYQHVLKRGAVGTALKLARLEIRSRQESEHLTWAQYVLYGDPAASLYGERAFFPEVHTVVFARANDSEQLGEAILRDLITAFPNCEYIHDPENGGCVSFVRPSEGVRFALLLHRRFRRNDGRPLIRIAISSGELLVEREEVSEALVGMTGLPVKIGKALLRIAKEGQTFTTRSVFDDARSMIRGIEIPGIENVSWLDHGMYLLKELDDPIGVREVGEKGYAPLAAPPESSQDHRSISPYDDPVLGWRPGLDQEIPSCPRWVLTEKLGEGGFGEVWRAQHRHSERTRVFKFCFRADRVRSLKRETTLFRILKEHLGPHSNIVQIHEVAFEKPPYFIAMDDVPGLNLAQWCEKFCGPNKVAESIRLEIVAKVADALLAAHEAGVIHRDVKPSNILVVGTPEAPDGIDIKLTDFGIGQVQSQHILADLPALGFTETYSRTEMTSASGSRLYMAPELLIGKESSIRSDIYSLGMVLYQILLGDCNRPLTVDWERDIEDPVLLEDLRGCLSGKASERFSSAAELATRLRSVEERRRSKEKDRIRAQSEARRKRLLHGVTVVAALVAVLAAFLGYGLRRAWIERENLEHSLYQLGTEEARRSIEDLDPGRAREILFASPERYRGWEWGYLAHRCNTDHRAFSHSSPIGTLALSADNRYLVTGDTSGVVKVWDFSSGEAVREVQSSTRAVQAISISSESTKMAVSDGHTIEVFDLDTKARSATFHPPNSLHGGICFAPGSNLLVAADLEGTLLLYDLDEGSTREFKSGHSGRVSDFSFLPDGQFIITLGEDSECHLLDTHTGEVRSRVEAPAGDLKSIAIQPDGKRFAVLSGGQLFVGETQSFNLAKTVYQVGGFGGSIAFAPDGRHLALSLDNHRVEIVDLESMGAPWRRGGGGGHPRSLAFTQDGRFLLTIDADGEVRQRPVRQGVDGEISLTGHTAWVHSLEFSPDGGRLATGSEDMTVSIWDTRTGAEKMHFLVYSGVQCLAWTPHGDGLAAGSESGEVFIWDAQSGETLRRFKAHEGRVMAIAIHPRGKSFATKGSRGDLVSWSFENGDQMLRVGSEPDEVLVYPPEGETLLTSGQDFTLQELDLQTGSPVRLFRGHSRPVRRVVVFPSGKRIASADEDGEIILWDRRSGKRVASFMSRVSLTHELIVSPDEKRLLTSVEIWDLENFRPIMPLPVDVKDLSLDGRLLAIGGAPHRVRIEGAFPFKEEELSAREDLTCEEKVEEYKRGYWRERPETATGKINPEFRPRRETSGIVGCWNFDRSDLEASVGRSLEFFGLQAKQMITFGTTGEFGVSSIEDELAIVLRFPGFSREMGLRVFSNAAQQEEDMLLAYTLILDILYPEEAKGLTRPIYNTDASNSSPAELVVSPTGGLGVEGVFQGDIQVGEWHRVACSVNLTGVPRMEKFIDGKPVGTQALSKTESDRWAVEEGLRGRSMLLLAGRDSEGAPCFVNSIQLRDYAMTAQEIASLGGPSSQGIPFD